MTPFDSKQFEISREDRAIARWAGPKDDETLAHLLALFRREKWRGRLEIDFPGNGGINNVVFIEIKFRKLPVEKENLQS